MSDYFGTQLNVTSTMTLRQKIALTILIAIAIITIIMWWIRSQPKDVMYIGPINVGPGEAKDQPWIPLMTADQIAKTASNNITCSFFFYVNSSSVVKAPLTEGSPTYLLTVGETMGFSIDAARQIGHIDILQAAPHSSKGKMIQARDSIVRTLDISKVLVSKWNQVTICVEGRSIDIYLNGKLANSAIMDNVPMNMFSGIMLNVSPDFQGQVALFQMWKGRRTGKEILDNYQRNTDLRGKPLVPDPELTFSGAFERFKKASCEKVGICGLTTASGPLQYVEYEFA